jgi:hypothetical protein
MTRRLLLLCASMTGVLGACSDDAQHGGNDAGATGLTGLGGLGGIGGNTFNQCGVAAPQPSDSGNSTAVSAPAIPWQIGVISQIE